MAKLLTEVDKYTVSKYAGGLDRAKTKEDAYCARIAKVGLVQPFDPLSVSSREDLCKNVHCSTCMSTEGTGIKVRERERGRVSTCVCVRERRDSCALPRVDEREWMRESG